MTKEKFTRVLGDISDSYIEDAIAYRPKKRRTVLQKWVAVAACLAVIVTLPIVNIILQGSQAGGVDGKINVRDRIEYTGEEYVVSDSEALEYLESVKEGIIVSLRASGVTFSELDIKEHGYSHIRTGDKGNTMALDWRDYLAYDGDKLVAIIQVTKGENGLRHYYLFGGEWFSYYEGLLEQYRGEELLYLYIGDVEAFITPDNEVISIMDTDISSTLEKGRDYYKYFKTEYNAYTP